MSKSATISSHEIEFPPTNAPAYVYDLHRSSTRAAVQKENRMRVLIELELNEPQVESVARMKVALVGSHRADLLIRKDGHDFWYEADFLRYAKWHVLVEPEKL